MGDIGHSFNSVGKFRSRATETIQKRWKKHLSARCPQTGCVPPVKILADMATHQHWTRQPIGLAVLMPGSRQLSQTIILGFPRISKHDGISISVNIAETVDPFIKAEQYMGTSLMELTKHQVLERSLINTLVSLVSITGIQSIPRQLLTRL